ncbi:MAG: hypothetical protein ACRDIA_09315, partial [Actinomycetota bacterium]
MLCAVLLASSCADSGPPAGRSVPRPVSPFPASPSSPQAPPGHFVAVKGDWGSGLPAQRQVTDTMCRVRKARTFEVVVTTGDNFYNPDGKATDGNYYGPE